MLKNAFKPSLKTGKAEDREGGGWITPNSCLG